MRAISSNIQATNQPTILSSIRSEFIDLRLRQFITENKIRDWPLDCVVLLRQMQQSGKYGILKIVTIKDLPRGIDAATHYYTKTKEYFMWFNRQKLRYPFQRSSDRRLNFTIAHEIGHIVLDHLILPSKKTETEKYMDDLEADEFAGRLLMPKELICSFNYYSLEAVASWLNVSNSALATRLHRLNRVDLILSRKVKSCPQCGNVRFSSFASYCGVCGHVRRKGDLGIRRIFYPDEIVMDSYKRSLVCPKCESSLDCISCDACPNCHTSIFNICSDDYGCSYANSAYARYCEICGKPTCYKGAGLFTDWKDFYVTVQR
ncbi:MAG: ImmA/IrrE family metallo-endopeptidase [Clostridiales bacterium]|nr:ImmA/IrrE family metallo-endopeptidase [Clostridiales bacterium]